jgi:hypothetical protein
LGSRLAIHNLRAAILKHIPEIKGMVTDYLPNSDIVCYFNLPLRTSTMRQSPMSWSCGVAGRPRKGRVLGKEEAALQHGRAATEASQLLHATHSGQRAPPHSNQEQI